MLPLAVVEEAAAEAETRNFELVVAAAAAFASMPPTVAAFSNPSLRMMM